MFEVSAETGLRPRDGPSGFPTRHDATVPVDAHANRSGTELDGNNLSGGADNAAPSSLALYNHLGYISDIRPRSWENIGAAAMTTSRPPERRRKHLNERLSSQSLFSARRTATVFLTRIARGDSEGRKGPDRCRPGQGLIKRRIPRGNQGAARGSRAVVFYRRGIVAVFLHIFPKSRKANLSKSELAHDIQGRPSARDAPESQLLAVCDRKGWRLLQI